MPPARKTNQLAVAAFVCSLVGLAVVVLAPVGVVLGHVAQRQARQRGESGAELALAAWIIGYVAIALWLVLAAALGALGLGYYLLYWVWKSAESTG